MIEAMKQALKALEANQPINYCMNNNGEKFPMFSNDPLRQERNKNAITSLRQAIKEASLNAMADNERELGIGLIGCVNHDCGHCQPKREWVGLTHDELPQQYKNDSVFVEGWLWAEAKLKEKNT